MLTRKPEVLMPRTVAAVFTFLPLLLSALACHALVSQENPPSSHVAELGGVVTFSGWTCPGGGGHHGTITMAVDGGPQETIGSRLSRNDTAASCKNDGRNGYAAIRNLGIDGVGQHTVRFFDDGVQFAQATYDVTTLGERFVREAGRTTVVRDFPRRGQTTTFQWTQGLQTFVPVDFCEGDCPCAVLENLSCSQKSTGSAAAAATVCNFCDTPVAPTTLRLQCGAQSSEASAGASLIGPGECRDVPCPDCELLVPAGICAAGDDATIAVGLTGEEELVGGARCCRDDSVACSLDRDCCSGACVDDGDGSVCRPATCGNDVLDSGESCDGGELDGFTCEDVVGGANGCNGKLACGAACGFDLSGCNCGCQGDLDCEVQIDCNAFVPGCTVFGACHDGTCVTSTEGTSTVCLGSDPEFDDLRCPASP